MRETIFKAMAIVSTCVLTSCIRIPGTELPTLVVVHTTVLFWIVTIFRPFVATATRLIPERYLGT